MTHQTDYCGYEAALMSGTDRDIYQNHFLHGELEI